MKTETTAKNSALVMRRVLLDQVEKLVKPEEVLNKTSKVPWRVLGSLERQCDLLEKLIEEIKSTNDSEQF